MRYTFVKQHDITDCAASCLAMVCLHYKKDITITDLRDIMGTDMEGTNLTGLSKAAKALGFQTKAIRVDKENFLTDFSLPCIAHTITEEGIAHFVVVFKKSKKYVVVGDPASDLKKISMDVFYKSFTGTLLLLVPNENFVPGKDKNASLFTRYLNLLLPHKRIFVYAILTSLILTIIGIASSIFNQVIMDEVLPYKLENTLLTVTMIWGFTILMQIVLSFIREFMLLHLSIKIDIPLMIGYFNHIFHLPIKFFSSRKTGDIITRFSDAFTIKNIYTSIGLTLLMDITMAAITGTILGIKNIKLFVIVVFMTILSILLVTVFKRPYKQINEEQMHQNAKLNSEIIEGLRGVETLKGTVSEDYEMGCIEKEYIKSLRCSYKESILSSSQNAISSIISGFGNLILTYIGISSIINGELTIGSFIAFTTIAGFFVDPVSRLVAMQLQIQEAGISMKRLSEILDQHPEEEKNSYENDHNDINIQNISFENVTFKYGSRSPVLKQVSFNIPKGKKIAIVGESGSGKSTIAKLLMRYYEIEDGEILINGKSISKYDPRVVRRAISYMPQSVELFSKSILDNIRISNPSASIDQVKEAARKADAHTFIGKLPLQYMTFLEEAGNGLSGGEKQRIALARAFLKKSDFYIFDESTSNLDFHTEELILKTIYKDLKDKSMLIIAHRIATIKDCDEIIVLENGQVTERGSHEELMQRKKTYYKMWQIQQGIVVEDNIENDLTMIVAQDETDTLTYLEGSKT